MKTIRATYPAPIPRTSFIGADIEDGIKVSFLFGKLIGFRNDFDQVDPETQQARRIASTEYSVELTPEEYNQLAALIGGALIRGGVVPVGTVYSIVDIVP